MDHGHLMPTEAFAYKPSYAESPRRAARAQTGSHMGAIELLLLRVLWLTLPLSAGPALSALAEQRSTPVVATFGALAAGAWTAGTIAVLVPHPIGLTTLRLVTTAAPAIGVLAATVARQDTGAAPTSLPVVLAAVVAGLAVLALSAAPAVIDRCVDGASYGPERRLALRAPLPVRLGPLPLAVAGFGLGASAGPLLLAARQWVVGSVLTVVGVVLAALAARAVHGLSRRWLVFVPAGVVLHDRFVLADPLLFPTRRIANVGPALATTTATDLTGSATGLVVEVALREAVEAGVRSGRTTFATRELTNFLVAPVRPGAFLREATDRGLPVDRAPANQPN